MKVGIFGAGAIGGYLGVRLAAGGHEVVLIGRQSLVDLVTKAPLEALGLEAEDRLSARPVASTDPAALSEVDLCVLAVKTAALDDIVPALHDNLAEDTPVVPVQNGLFAVERLRAAGCRLPVFPGLVVFNVVWEGARFRQTTSGPVAVAAGHPAVEAWAKALSARGVETVVSDDIERLQAGKLLLNANNGLCALTGLPLRSFLESRPARRSLALLMKEGLRIFKSAGRRVGGFGLIDPRLAARILPLPDALFFRAAQRMLTIDPAAKTSTLQDIERGRKTEIDALTGGVVEVAARAGLDAPLSRWVVEEVKRLERGEGQVRSPEALWLELLAVARP